MKKRDIFIGGAWPYANYYLHVGHLAALLPGDVLAKYFRINGDRVIYVSGSDCHGTPITERAKKENSEPENIAKHYHSEFEKTFERLGFEYDNYSKTMSDFHKNYVQKCFKKLIQNGYIYEKDVPQDFCEKCNKFLSDREIAGICPKCGGKSTGEQCEDCLISLDSSQVLKKHCKDCNSELVMKNNKHLYFKLSAFQENLQKLINNRQNTWRRNALGESQKFIDMGLIDRAATRQINWGVEVPVENYKDKRIYVWIEAVLGYLSAGEEVAEKEKLDFDNFLSDDNKKLTTYYVHGKDNIPFHTIIFPALLMGLDKNYRMPDYVISSAYVNLNNEKMSKRTGNLITANELLEIFKKDTLRYYFMFYGPETRDTNCSVDEIKKIHNKFLVGALGNFVNRNFSYIVKNFNGKIPEADIDEKIIEHTEQVYKNMGLSIEKGEFKNAVIHLNDYINLGNRYYDERKPWNQVKENIKEFNNTTYTCLYIINNLSNLIYPFMPDTAQKIKSMISTAEYKLEPQKNLSESAVEDGVSEYKWEPEEHLSGFAGEDGFYKYKWEPSAIKGDFKITNPELLFERLI